MANYTARFAIADFITPGGAPLVVEDCYAMIPDSEELSVLIVDLAAEDTIDLCGKYVYQLTIEDEHGRTAVLKGMVKIDANYDRGNA